jgi:hypothetical protein
LAAGEYDHAEQQQREYAQSAAAGDGGYHEERCSFLKKRTKKLLPVGIRGPFRLGPRTPASKSFLLLFFKK